METLEAVTFQLPKAGRYFSGKLFDFLAPFGEREVGRLSLAKSDSAFVPDIAFTVEAVGVPKVQFELGDNLLEIELVNKTGEKKRSPETYQLISLDEVIGRIGGSELVRLDHVGFNLPWFDGVHPDVLKLRKELAPVSAYYRFPTGENWDFILPATESEIRSDDIDLAKERRSKLEIVSFGKCSTPLIQIDFSVNKPFDELQGLFPEAIVDPTLRNIWVYLENPYGIDICLVIGEGGDDWSKFFDGHRLTP